MEIHVSLNFDKNNSYFIRTPIRIFIISRSILLIMRNVSDKIVERIKTLVSENLAVYKTMWSNMVEPDRSQTTVHRMRFACRIPKATNTYSEYVILIAFPLQR